MTTYETTIFHAWFTKADTLCFAELSLEIEMRCTQHEVPPSGRDEFYDPGGPPEFEIEMITLDLPDGDNIHQMQLEDREFTLLFPGFAHKLDNAIDWAIENYNPTDYEADGHDDD